MLKTSIVVSFTIAGLHQWAECFMDKVSFLVHPHRHLFYIRATKGVTHNNRDIEIICFQNILKEYLKRKYYNYNFDLCDFGNRSCEMIAEELLKEFDLTSCEVLEDNENGAKVEI